MKVRTPILAAAIALFAAAGAAAEPACQGAPGPGLAKLVVENTNLRNGDGEVQTTVYPDDASRFLARHGKVARARALANTPGAATCFWLAPGFYAVAVYHDANDNHAFDRNALGMPAEGFGFSNDAPTRFGQPSFSAVRFKLPPEGLTLRIRMRYQTKPG
jgi:uncharacterized protein (DUF2141 family)